MKVCPLVFEPILKPKIWGGRRLAELFGKKMPEGTLIGESWECADLDSGQSVVARGPVKGQSLRRLIEEWGVDLLGSAELADGRFPLLIKFLDAREPLSIQVHPDEQAIAYLGLRETVKHEAWHIVYAAHGAVIHRGLRPGVSIIELGERLKEDPKSIVTLLQCIPVKAGDTYFLPSGTIHALGAGVVVAEVQTPADVTFRLYDWGRTRPAGDTGLHVEQALACVRAEQDYASFEKRSHVTSVFTTVTRLVSCPSFVIEKVQFVEGIEQDIPYAECVCWIVLCGGGQIRYDKTGVETFSKGDVVLLPAGLKGSRLKTLAPCTWLEVTLPVASDLAGHTRPEGLSHPVGDPDGPGFVQLNVERDGPSRRVNGTDSE